MDEIETSSLCTVKIHLISGQEEIARQSNFHPVFDPETVTPVLFVLSKVI
jgi:hypothetical protein